MKTQTLRLLALLLVSLMLMTGALVSCTVDPTNPYQTNPETTPEADPETDPQYETITIAEALALCGEPGNLTTERYYVRGTVKTVTNPAYGDIIVNVVRATPNDMGH